MNFESLISDKNLVDHQNELNKLRNEKELLERKHLSEMVWRTAMVKVPSFFWELIEEGRKIPDNNKLTNLRVSREVLESMIDEFEFSLYTNAVKELGKIFGRPKGKRDAITIDKVKNFLSAGKYKISYSRITNFKKNNPDKFEKIGIIYDSFDDINQTWAVRIESWYKAGNKVSPSKNYSEFARFCGVPISNVYSKFANKNNLPEWLWKMWENKGELDQN